MASYLRPRRGKKATAVSQLTASAPLKRGEIFFEVPDTGVGTGTGKIKMGDGTTAYASLPYFMEQPVVDYTNAVVGWTNTTAADSDPYSTNATYAGNIIPSASLKTIFTNLKKLLLNYNSQLTTLNNDLGNFLYPGCAKNAIYRGKDLGTISASNIASFLTEHEVSSGKFTDLYVGDIITIQDGTYNAKWIIAGFDTEYYRGDTALSTHHISLIPQTYLFTAPMNDTNTTEGGYAGSKMHTTTLPALANVLKTALSSHLLNRRVLLSTSMSTTIGSAAGANWTGASNNWAWTDAYCTLLSEIQVYGAPVFSSSFYDTGEACNQLPIFNFANHVQFGRAHFWLRAVASSTTFAVADGNGGAYGHVASNSSGVRPLICIG